jgi:phospholipase/carboxylesterase
MTDRTGKTTKSELGFTHHFIPSAEKGNKSPTLLLLHGTGGNEQDLIPLGQELYPHAAVLSPRGKVLEGGMTRFFRRVAEGIFDIEDLKFRTQELADFVEEASRVYDFNLQNVISIGYSNGANIASSLLLLRPEVLSSAVLFRPMIPLSPEKIPDLTTKNILMAAGERDPIVPREQTEMLYDLFKKAGANVSLRWQKNSGHGLGYEEISAAREWLSQIPI